MIVIIGLFESNGPEESFLYTAEETRYNRADEIHGIVGRPDPKYLSTLKVHKRENFLGFDFEICTFS